MPPDGRCLADEGIVIPPTSIESIGDDFFKDSRSPADNLADLKAQIVANRYGVKALRKLADQSSVKVVDFHMRGVYDRSSMLLARALEEFEEASAEDQMDDGSVIRVKISKDEKLVVDFSGSADVHSGNLNATPAIVRSAVLYALRLWVRTDVPLNEGLLDQVEIVTDLGILDPPLTRDPEACPAVI